MIKGLSVFFLVLFTTSSSAQLMGFQLPEGEKKVEIPFEFRNNLILIDLIFDDVFPLTFIFDTGSENTILVKKEFTDLLNVSYEREFAVLGADYQKTLVAYLTRNINMDLPNLLGSKLDILVLKEDYFQFEEFTGLTIHGILGMDLFKTFTIEINYKKQILTLHRVEDFKVPDNRFSVLEADIHRNKPYIQAVAEVKGDTATNVKLLLDTGASLSLMLHNDSDSSIVMPSKLIPGKLGNGLGGYIAGFVGRINQLAFDNYEFNGVITNFQEVGDSLRYKVNNDRNGIIGNEILSRFTVIFDIARSKVYFKPIKRYNRFFKYDKSGISLIASGEALSEFRVKELVPNSPAEEAGVQVGDKLVNINYTPTSFYDLRKITRILQRRSGKRIRLVILRNGERKVFKFTLRDLI
ncbi:MAG: PDZ domain-containing protein [Bacteroidota bacterium]